MRVPYNLKFLQKMYFMPGTVVQAKDCLEGIQKELTKSAAVQGSSPKLLSEDMKVHS